jgi:hypothetical protein
VVVGKELLYMPNMIPLGENPRDAFIRWLRKSLHDEHMDKLRERWLADDNGRKRKHNQ